jgi:GNAT superfamily N-acetyltransferase
LHVVRLEELPLDDLQPLLVESRRQGYEFLDRLVDEYQGGINRFSGPAEGLFAIYNDQDMVAIGGLNRDPYLVEGEIGRVRHVYVLSAWRRQGIGKILMSRIIEFARANYHLLTLRTFSDGADQFYRALGFRRSAEIQAATHYLHLDR